jgi:hypothetical protein
MLIRCGTKWIRTQSIEAISSDSEDYLIFLQSGKIIILSKKDAENLENFLMLTEEN